MTHAPVQPKDAASVMLIRSGSRGLEILFLRRNPSLAFQGDHWVFPGGRIDPIDKDVDRPHDELAAAQKAAVREAAEESGVSVPLHSLVYAIHWTTPVTSPIRFSTSFFIAPAPPEDILIDGNEIHEFLWLRPADALARHRARTFKLAAPTFALTTRINAFCTVDEALLGVAAWPKERLIGEIRETEDGRVALYYPDTGLRRWRTICRRATAPSLDGGLWLALRTLILICKPAPPLADKTERQYGDAITDEVIAQPVA